MKKDGIVIIEHIVSYCYIEMTSFQHLSVEEPNVPFEQKSTRDSKVLLVQNQDKT